MKMLNRRELLKYGLGGAAITISTFPGSALANNVGDWKAQFDAALAENPRLLGWQGISTDRLETPRLALTGKLPAGLQGTFYRNGPAQHERAGRRYHHWFDGDGMVQAFRFDGTSIRHRGRMVATKKRAAEEKAGRFVYPAFGTVVPGSPPLRGPDDVNPANISTLSHAGELLALWEGGSAHRLDPETLETKGLKVWRDDLAGVPFSAHPKVEPDRTLWNFGYTSRGFLVLYHIGANGKLRRVAKVDVPKLGMVHDFIVTARHLVFVLPPLVFEPRQFGRRSFLDANVWRPELGTRVLVIEKDDFARRRWFQLPAGFTFHFGNSWEDKAGLIRFDYCVAPDATVMTETLRHVMRGEMRAPTGATRFATAVLDPRKGTARQSILPQAAEFPRVSPRVVSRRYRYVYTIGDIAVSGSNGITK